MPRTALAIPALLLACSPAPPTYLADIQPLTEAHCASCHSDGNIAPFALDSYDALVDFGPAVRRAVMNRTMPPWHAEPGHRAYRYDWSLSDAQVERFDEWFELGAPLGDTAGERIELERAQLPSVDVELTPEVPFVPDPETSDEYRCFAMDWPLTETAYVSGFEGVPGNVESVHHMLAFIVPPSSAARVRGFEGDDGRPGYPCFGGVTKDGWQPANASETVLFNFGGQWAPGLSAQPFPEGTGMPIEPGSLIVLQMHYTTLGQGDLTDQSTARFSVRDEVEALGYSVAWMDVGWVTNPPSMKIPAGSTDTWHSYTARLDANPVVDILAPDFDLTSPVKLHSVLPHMHVLGREIVVERVRGDTVETLVRIPDYDFNWQRVYELMEPMRVLPTDALQIRCNWDNSEAARRASGLLDPAPSDVTWGEGTVEEMCIALLYMSQPLR